MHLGRPRTMFRPCRLALPPPLPVQSVHGMLAAAGRNLCETRLVERDGSTMEKQVPRVQLSLFGQASRLRGGLKAVPNTRTVARNNLGGCLAFSGPGSMYTAMPMAPFLTPTASTNARGFFVSQRLPHDDVSTGTWNRHGTPFPVGLTVDAAGTAGGSAFVLQVHYLRGEGRLRVPDIVAQCTAEAARVALSWVMLHTQDLEQLCGCPLLHDLCGKWRELDVAITPTRRTGHVSGYSLGVLLALCMITQLTTVTGCRPLAKTAVTGELSLEGEVLSVGAVPEKADGAVRAGMRTIVVPRDNVRLGDLSNYPSARSLHVEEMSTMAEALKYSIEGWRRRAITVPHPSTSLAVLRVPVSYDHGTECEKVEVCVLPGTGQVHITGLMEPSVRASLEAALFYIEAHLDEVEDSLTRATGRGVVWRFDLTDMKRSGDHERKTIDLHIHLPNASYEKIAPVYGPAVVVGLLSLMAGLSLPADLGISAQLCASGRLLDFMGGRLSTLRAASQAGLRKVVVVDHDARKLKQLQQQHQPLYADVEVIGAAAVPEMLLKVFEGAELLA